MQEDQTKTPKCGQILYEFAVEFLQIQISRIFLLTIWNLYHEFWGDKENFFLILKFTWNLRTENTEFLVSNVSMFFFHEFCKNS